MENITNDKSLISADLASATIKQTLVKTGFSLGIDLPASVIPGGAFLSGPAKSLLRSMQSQI